MRVEKNGRGFRAICHDTYPPDRDGEKFILTESSAVGDYEDSLDKPGSSYLWIGFNHHLNREEVKTLCKSLRHWLKHGRLPEKIDG